MTDLFLASSGQCVADTLVCSGEGSPYPVGYTAGVGYGVGSSVYCSGTGYFHSICPQSLVDALANQSTSANTCDLSSGLGLTTFDQQQFTAIFGGASLMWVIGVGVGLLLAMVRKAR